MKNLFLSFLLIFALPAFSGEKEKEQCQADKIVCILSHRNVCEHLYNLCIDKIEEKNSAVSPKINNPVDKAGLGSG